MLKDLSGSIKALNTITTSMADGHGTLGALMQDKGLYEELRTLTEDAQNLVKNIQDQPKRYVHFSLFGRKDDASDKSTNTKND